MKRVTRGRRGPLHGRGVLVTGGSGFLGAHVARELARRGARLVLHDTALKRPDLLAPVLEPGGATLLLGDLARLDASPALVDQMAQVDYVVHLSLAVPGGPGAVDVAEWRARNNPPFEGLLARLPMRLRGVVLASTLAVYGAEHAEPVAEGCPLVPASPLAVVKVEMETALREFAHRRGLPASILRLSTLFGPGEANSPRAIPSFIRNVLMGQSPVIYGDGADVFDYLYVVDAAVAVAQALEHLAGAPGTYNIGSGQGWSLRAIAEAVQQQAHVALPPKHMPPRGPRHCLVADIRCAQAALGFQPATPLGTGLAAEIEYARAFQRAAGQRNWLDPLALLAHPGAYAADG